MTDTANALAVAEPKEPTLALPDADEWARINAIAEQLAQSQIVPVAYRRKSHDIVAATLAGRELGLTPMSAMQRIFIIDGKPGLSAEAMVALVHRSGHELWVDPASNDEWAKVYGQRKGSERVHEMTFTIEEAKAAGLLGKDNWKKYPKSMLRARALSALCRTTFADVLAGYVYTPEELGAPVDEEGNVIAMEVRDGIAQVADVQQPETPRWIAAHVERFGEEAVIEASEKIRQQLNVGVPIKGLGGLAKATDGSDVARRIIALLERDYPEIQEAEVVTDVGEQGSENAEGSIPSTTGSAVSEPTGAAATADGDPAPATPTSQQAATGGDTETAPGDSSPGAEGSDPADEDVQPFAGRVHLLELLDSAVKRKVQIGRMKMNEGLLISKAVMLQEPDEEPFTGYADMTERATDELLMKLVAHYKLEERLAGVA
jgi:hypothetical protein